MKRTLFTAACVLALSTALASAQSSQGNVGPGTNNNNSGMMNNNTGGNMGGSGNMAGSGKSTTGSGMTNSGMKDGRNPSSQGNVGPGTTPGNPGSSAPSK